MTRKYSKRLKVYFLTSSNAGTAFYRMFQFKEEMNKSGLARAIIPWYRREPDEHHHAQQWQWHIHDNYDVSGRNGLVPQMVAQADVIVVQYLHTIEALCLVEALKACHPDKVFLTEIDDYIHETPVEFACYKDYQPGSKYRTVVEEQIKALDGVIVSTPYLKEVYSELNPHIYVVPNALDFKHWEKFGDSRSKRETRIGWAGAGNHDADLETIEEPIKKYLSETDKVSFHHMVHGIPENFKDQPKIVWHKHWVTVDKWPKRLSKVGMDIGLCPAQPNDFKKGKSNLRRLQYAAMGIPVVARNWGHTAETMEHGKDGFLYDTEEEFTSYLNLLVKNKQLREDMGLHNKLTAKRDFSIEKVTAHYVDVLREAKERGQTTTVDVSDSPNKPQFNRALETING